MDDGYVVKWVGADCGDGRIWLASGERVQWSETILSACVFASPLSAKARAALWPNGLAQVMSFAEARIDAANIVARRRAERAANIAALAGRIEGVAGMIRSGAHDGLAGLSYEAIGALADEIVDWADKIRGAVSRGQ